MPKICLLTQYFPPEMGAPPNRLWELAERLLDLGWEVEALTALPNYPTGRIYDGYNPTSVVVEWIGRIRTVRVPIYPAKDGYTKRIRSYLSFVKSARRYGLQYCTCPDVLFVESPPLFIVYAATYLARKWHCGFVFNVSDLWPESVVRLGQSRSRILIRLARRMERRAYERSIGVTGQSNEIIEAVRRTSPSTPTAVITNGVDPARFVGIVPSDEVRRSLVACPAPIYLYAGLMGLAQGLDAILDVAKDLPEDVPGHFVLLGDGPRSEHLRERVDQERISRVTVLPKQRRELVPEFLKLADVAIVTLGVSIPGAVPSKIYEAMAAGKPILLVANGEAATRITEANCGLTVPIGDTTELAKAIKTLSTSAALRDSLGKAGRAAAETTYNRDRISLELDRFLRRVIA